MPNVKGDPLSAEELETVRRLYAAGELSNIEIGRRYGKRPNWVNTLASKHGWPLRTKAAPAAPKQKPATMDGRKVRRPHASRGVPPAAYEASSRAEIEARERAIYRAHFVQALAMIAADKGYARQRVRKVLAALDLAQLHATTISSASGGGRHRAAATEKIVRAAIGAPT